MSACNVEDLLITCCHISAKEIAGKLGALDMHQVFHQPHLPNCTASLTYKYIVPVVLKVVMKDKYNLAIYLYLFHINCHCLKFG